jgi:hypothetical protein
MRRGISLNLCQPTKQFTRQTAKNSTYKHYEVLLGRVAGVLPLCGGAAPTPPYQTRARRATSHEYKRLLNLSDQKIDLFQRRNS